MKQTHLMLALLVVFVGMVVLGSVFLLPNRRDQRSAVGESETAEVDREQTSSPEVSALLAGGSSYADPGGVYTFLYPNDYVLDTEDPQHIRIYKRGETQRPQSEMSDGALMVFETITLSGKTLSEWIDAYLQELTADGTVQIIQPKKELSVGSYQGYTYTTRGLGEAVTTFVQKDENSPFAVSVTTAVSDPEQKGYQKDIDAVLATLELFK